jgi:hypothetical protein
MEVAVSAVNDIPTSPGFKQVALSVTFADEKGLRPASDRFQHARSSAALGADRTHAKSRRRTGKRLG